MAKKKDEYIALSSYCKKHDLSISKDFDIGSFVLTVKENDQTGAKVSGWKFRVDVLDEYVPKLGFKTVQRRPTEPDEIFAYTTLIDDQEVYVFAALKPSTEKKFIRELEDIIDVTLEKVDDIGYDDVPAKLIESLNVIGKLIDGESFADNIDLGKAFNNKFHINVVNELQDLTMNSLIEIK